MRSLVLLSAVVMTAGVMLSPAAKADTPDWYVPFQTQACQHDPAQAGCSGFEKMQPTGTQPMEKPAVVHRVHHMKKHS